MAWTKMAEVPNPIFDTSGDPYSGAVLKAYLPGTTTGTSIAIDKDGSSPQATITANSDGIWEVSGNEIIPYIDRECKWAIFANATDATANTPAYMGFFDTVEQVQSGDTDAWVLFSGTPTQTSTTTFTLTGDQTTTFTVGTRLKLDDSSTLYGIVTASVYTSLTTITVIATGSLSGSLSVVYTDMKTDSGQSRQLHFDARTYLVPGSRTITTTCKFDDGALISVSSGQTLTLNAKVVAGDYQVFTGDGTVTGAIKSKEIPDVWWGAVGGGTDDTTAMQAAINCAELSGNPAVFTQSDSRVSVTKGTNDKYGLNIDSSNVTVYSRPGASVRRLSSDISTYALSFPILLVGKPDSNDINDQIQKIKVKGIKFVGEDTQHASNGSALSDGRHAIELKNTKKTKVIRCEFDDIDSQAIWYQHPVQYDYENSQWFNTTKNYNSKIIGCDFIAESHVTNGRALVHALTTRGVDGITVGHNYFEWTDDAISTATTYDVNTGEDDTYTPTSLGGAWTLGAVKRSGRDVNFSNNRCFNCSEHAIYFTGRDEVAQGNTISTDEYAICDSAAIKTTGISSRIVGNSVEMYGSGINVSAPATNVTVNGNTVNLYTNVSASGGINISSDSLTSVISGKSDYITAGRIMRNISVTGNTVEFRTASAGGNYRHLGMYIWSDTSDGSYSIAEGGQMSGLTISGNTFKNHNIGIRFDGELASAINVTGNTFLAKPFTGAAFSTGTTMDTWAVLACEVTHTDAFREVMFTNNYVRGCKYLFASSSGSGTANTIEMPLGCSGNRLDYVQNIKTGDIKSADFQQQFTGNSGRFFMDRGFNAIGTALFNALSDGNANSEKRSMMDWDGGTSVRFYTDDAGTTLALS